MDAQPTTKRSESAQPAPNPRQVRWAVGLLSAAITSHQLGLMQVLAYVHWHHFAYMVVAVALLGFGIAGTVLTLARVSLLSRSRTLLPWLTLGSGLMMPLGVYLSQLPVLAFDLHLLFVDSRQWFALVAAYACLLPPFFLGGLAISLVLTQQAQEAGRAYFASLIGSGVGGIVGLLALTWVLPARLPFLAGIVAVVATALVWREVRRTRRAAALGVVAVLALLGWRETDLRASEFKAITRVRELPEATIEAQWPSAHGWVQIVSAPALRPAPALSLNYFGELVPHPAVFINGYMAGSLLPPAQATDADWLDYTTGAVAYAGVERPRVLLLEPGPGGAATLARMQGASQIVVTEPHRSLAAFLEAGGQAGLPAPEWAQPEVQVIASTGRRALRQGTAGTFDLIVFPPTGTTGGAGMTSATEEFLFTRHAVQEAWRKLSPSGALSLTAPMDFPVRHSLRLLATVLEALEAEGIDQPREHLLAVRGWSTVTFLAQRAPITPAQAEAVREFCEDRSFDPLLLPDLEPDERNQYNLWPDPQFFAQIDALSTPDRDRLYSDYPFKLRPATDERPWFAQFLKWTGWSELAASFGQGRLPFLELGTLMVALTFGQLLVLAIVGILLPLAWLGTVRGRRAGTVFYFAGLGAGFMLIEIGLMLRLHGWLGNPLASAAVVLVGLLVFAGCGSLWSERLPARPGIRLRVLAGILAVITIAGLVQMMRAPAGWPWALQLLLAAALMALLGLVMGMAFPLGLRELERRAPTQVPWAWGINGCISVATPAGAMLLAMEGGVTLLFVVGLAAYGLAWLGARIDRSITP